VLLLLCCGWALDQDVVGFEVHMSIPPAVHVADASTYLQARSEQAAAAAAVGPECTFVRMAGWVCALA
jgi:hypothetical protein